MKIPADVAEMLREGLSNAEVSRRTGIHPVKVADIRRGLGLPSHWDMKGGPVAGPSHRAHGTRAKYVVEKCRCKPCREANSRENRVASRRRAYGRWQPYVDAGPAREHVKALQAYGLGWKRIARLAGVPISTMSKLLYGDSRRGPSKQIRPENEAKLLAVQPTPDALGGHTTTDATGTRRRLQALVAAGWPQAHLARRLLMSPSNMSLILTVSEERVFVATARAVRALYDEWWNADPQAHGVTLQAFSRARNHARAVAWAPAGAWDEDRIDDPAAIPDWTGKCGTPQGYHAHRRHGLLPPCQPCKDAHNAAHNPSSEAAA